MNMRASIWDFSQTAIGLVAVTICLSVGAGEHNTLTAEEQAAGWQLLFDGETTSSWRNYQAEELSAGWQAVDGTLARISAAGDIVTLDQFEDFELQLEARILEGGNSGVFIRAGESEPYIFMSAPEIQILDDARHRDGKSPLTSAGSNYGLHPAPRGVANPAGEWNHIRVRVTGESVTQWLNGVEIADYELGSEDWQARVDASKFSAWPIYGTLARGHIGLQDHGDPVAFRNIKIRRLDSGP
jgi:hypothetical protein